MARWPLACVVLVLACATEPGMTGDDDGSGSGSGSGSGELGPHQAPPYSGTDTTDDDADMIPDALEHYLAEQFAPELRLPPDDVDWTRPANVGWYLPKVHMRFDHPNCGDHQILALGAVTSTAMGQQMHETTSGVAPFCSHTGTVIESGPTGTTYTPHKQFFLQPEDDNLVHPGIPPSRKAEWRVYTHVKKSSFAQGGTSAAYDIQVWFFYAYNDFVASANHEADWEHMTISVTADLRVLSVYFATHHDGTRVDDLSTLSFVDRTHPVGFAADGSHATYPSEGTHATGFPGVSDHTYANGPTWQTWTNFVNLGERNHILDGLDWASYAGRWGEVGNVEDTSGPVGPMYNSKWLIKGSEY